MAASSSGRARPRAACQRQSSGCAAQPASSCSNRRVGGGAQGVEIAGAGPQRRQHIAGQPRLHGQQPGILRRQQQGVLHQAAGGLDASPAASSRLASPARLMTWPGSMASAPS